MKKFIWIPFLVILSLPNSLFAEIANLTSGFIDLADSPSPDVSNWESLEDTETTSENTEE